MSQLLSSNSSFRLVELLPPTACSSPLIPLDVGLFGSTDHQSEYSCEHLLPDLVLDQQELFSDLNDSMRVKVREALLKKHHHQNEKKRNNLIPIVRSFAEVGKKQSDPHSMDKNGKIIRSDFIFY